MGGELVAQHHVANMNGVGEGRVFGEFFERSCWIVVVHGIHSSAGIADVTTRLARVGDQSARTPLPPRDTLVLVSFILRAAESVARGALTV